MWGSSHGVGVIAIACLSLLQTGVTSQHLPESFSLCNVTNPNHQKCLIRAVQKSFTLLKNGIPSLGVLAIDPLAITGISMQQGSGSAALTVKLTNVLIHGFSNVRVTRAATTMQRGGVDIRLEIISPQFEIISDYSIRGRISILPISGSGKSNFTLRDVKITVDMENDKEVIDGEEYIKVNNFNAHVFADKIFVNMGNLFGGNEILGKQMNIFMNENSKEIFSELTPAIEEAFGEVFKLICNRIFSKVPYKNIFLH